MKNKETALSVVIVNWNVAGLLAGCIDSIEKNLADVAHEVIVVDNASADESVTIVKSRFPFVRLIENRKNSGFARANNQGFEVAKGEYILILNPDTLIKDDSVQKMIRVLEKNPDIGMVGPRIVDENGRITPECKRQDITLWRLFLKRLHIKRVTDLFFNRDKYFLTSEPTAFLQGSCMLVRKRDLDRIGYFDENVPMYLDDIDLCHRFRKAGFKVFYESGAGIIHFGRASTKKVGNPGLFNSLACQGTDKFLYKHKGVIHVVINHIILFFASLFSMIADIFVIPLVFLSGKRGRASDILFNHIGMFIYSLSFKVIAKDIES